MPTPGRQISSLGIAYALYPSTSTRSHGESRDRASGSDSSASPRSSCISAQRTPELTSTSLQAALPVPVWTSSLLLLPGLANADVVTVDAASLGADHLRAAGADPATPVEGIAPGSAFQRTLLDDLADLDIAEAEREVVAAARRLLRRAPGLTDIVLECTNMPPYADAVRRATGRRVHDITTLIAQRVTARALPEEASSS